jgi:uncharacterized protein (TIGR03435 family)
MLLLKCFAAGVLVADVSSAQWKFEVASVKLAAERGRAGAGAAPRNGGGGFGGGGCPQSLKMDRGRVEIQCATVATLIGYAYRFSPDRVKGPDWMMGTGSPRFDIVAKVPEGASASETPEMLQALLADRFHLTLHRGTTQQAPIYALVAAKGGLKLAAAAAARPGEADVDGAADLVGFYGGVQTRTSPAASTISNPRMGTVRETHGPNGMQRWEANATTLEGVADLLDKVGPLSSPVIDMTGVKGRYQLVLEVSLNDLGAADRMDFEESVLQRFNTGLRKLGLELERRKGALETLIVDHVERMPTEN